MPSQAAKLFIFGGTCNQFLVQRPDKTVSYWGEVKSFSCWALYFTAFGKWAWLASICSLFLISKKWKKKKDMHIDVWVRLWLILPFYSVPVWHLNIYRNTIPACSASAPTPSYLLIQTALERIIMQIKLPWYCWPMHVSLVLFANAFVPQLGPPHFTSQFPRCHPVTTFTESLELVSTVLTWLMIILRRLLLLHFSHIITSNLKYMLSALCCLRSWLLVKMKINACVSAAIHAEHLSLSLFLFYKPRFFIGLAYLALQYNMCSWQRILCWEIGSFSCRPQERICVFHYLFHQVRWSGHGYQEGSWCGENWNSSSILNFLSIHHWWPIPCIMPCARSWVKFLCLNVCNTGHIMQFLPSICRQHHNRLCRLLKFCKFPLLCQFYCNMAVSFSLYVSVPWATAKDSFLSCSTFVWEVQSSICASVLQDTGKSGSRKVALCKSPV